jgi:uncharacterized membrane protein
MALLDILRWSQKNQKSLRILDYVLGAITIVIGIWQDSMVGIILGIVFILAAFLNLSQKIKFFMPRIQPPRDK